MPNPTLPLDFSEKAPASPDEGHHVLSVADLDRAIKRSLDLGFEQPVWVEGEVTGARAATSGHLYLCLKDEREDAAIDVVLYKANITQRMRTLVVDGARVRLRGRPTLWAPRGRLQFVADRAEPVGKGALLEALEKLKAKLSAEGLFASERKRALPTEPRVIGVVTSAGGAVIHDICRVAFRRGGAHILLAPALVQGSGAAASVQAALQVLQQVEKVDVIILGRGGGSSDDLSCFNDEALVRAVAACRVAVVSAVGHEVDVTLTDFVADARAATPSQAAEMVVADARARAANLMQAQVRLVRAVRARITEEGARLGDLLRRVDDPRLALASFQQSLDDRVGRLQTRGRRILDQRRDRVATLHHRLLLVHPKAVIARERAGLAREAERLQTSMHARLARRGATLEALGARMDAMSPLKVLGRGYAIATRDDGRAIREPRDVMPGDPIRVRALHALVHATVLKVEKDPLA